LNSDLTAEQFFENASFVSIYAGLRVFGKNAGREF
jgi:hypothetical protein